MNTPAHSQRSASAASRGWLPAQAEMPRALDVSHWLSRAARGHTWNGHGAMTRAGTRFDFCSTKESA
jgi:hypothetical protein